MVKPLVQEAEWIAALGTLPRWTPPKETTVVISPHPDDETLACGGLIRHLANESTKVLIVAVTDGENAYEGEIGLGPIREAEQAAALAELGVTPADIYRLRMPDSGLRQVESDLVDALSGIAKPNMHIVAPWTGDFHPDHEVCGRAAQVVADAIGARLTFYFFWTWHRGTPALLDEINVVSFPLASTEWNAKQSALRCHHSQLNHRSGHPILPDDLLGPMQRPFEVFLPA